MDGKKPRSRSGSVGGCGRSTGKKKPGVERWWWNADTEDEVKETKDILKIIWKQTGAEIDGVECKTAEAPAKGGGWQE